MTALYRVFGPHLLAPQLWVAVVGSLAAVLAYRFARALVPEPWAIACGLTMALLPSAVVWSSVVLKDAIVGTLLGGLALAVLATQRERGRRLALAWGAVAALLAGLAATRSVTGGLALVA